MDAIIEILKNRSGFIGGNGCNKEEIIKAEKELGTPFSEEYKIYLKNVGLACFDGHELTGICSDSRLNVVEVTLEERQRNVEVLKEGYVIEQANIDGIVIWQLSSGEIYQTCLGNKPRKLCKSLADYVQNNY